MEVQAGNRNIIPLVIAVAEPEWFFYFARYSLYYKITYSRWYSQLINTTLRATKSGILEYDVCCTNSSRFILC